MKIQCRVIVNRGTQTFVSKKGKEITITSYVVEMDNGKIYDARLFGRDSSSAKKGETIYIEMTQFGRSARTHEIEISGEIVKA